MEFLKKYQDYTITVINHKDGLTFTSVMSNNDFATECKSVFNWDAFKIGEQGFPQNDEYFIVVENKNQNVVIYLLGD